MRKIKRMVLYENSHVLPVEVMRTIQGGANVLIYSCVCSKEGVPNKHGTVKVMAGVNPETAILSSSGACSGYTSASCAFSASV